MTSAIQELILRDCTRIQITALWRTLSLRGWCRDGTYLSLEEGGVPITENRQTPQGLRALKGRKGFMGGDKGPQQQLQQILCDFEKTGLFVVSTYL